MPLNTRLQWFYSAIRKGRLNFWKNPMPEVSASPASIYQNCSELPMGLFLNCMFEKDLKYLVKEGRPSFEVLTEKWSEILSEYYEIKGETVDHVDLLRIRKEMRRTRNHLVLVDACVQFLAEQYSESIARSLRKLGYFFNPVEKEPAAYMNELVGVVNQSKTKYIQLQQLIKEYEKEEEKEKGKKVSRADFETSLSNIEEMQHSAYDLDKMSVLKFVTLERKLIKRIESLNAKNHGNGKN